MRQSLSYDPEVAVATIPSSQLVEGASNASESEDHVEIEKTDQT